MINLTINLEDGSEVDYSGLITGVDEALKAAKTLHPTWTSIILTLVKVIKPE